MTNNDVPRYVISVAARMVGIPTYTLRYYEKVGIMVPSRSRGNLRLYSDRDLIFLRRVKTLMEDLGINLAGIEVILRMTQRVRELQHQVEELESELRRLRETESRFQGQGQTQ
ncbi:MAG: MerR family transcriptional regulator [Chloroflexi bacterium]|nr:MerR family transcriptional regulator [Chloroflexota bacterium]